MNTNETPDQNQLLLELHYGLLDDEQAAELRSRIASDSEVAMAWAQTLRLAGKMASAAKIESEETDLNLQVNKLVLDDKASVKSSKPSDSAVSRNGATESVASSLRLPPTQPLREQIAQKAEAKITGRWLAVSLGLLGLAASVAITVVGVRYIQVAPSRPVAQMQLQATAAPGFRAASPNEFEIVAKRIERPGAPSMPVIPAMMSFSVLMGDSVLFSGQAEADQNGSTNITIPSALAIPNGAKLKISAEPKSDEVSASTLEIPLEPTRCLTYLTVDRPVYRPGEIVYFRSLTLNRRSLAAHVDVPVRFELIDPSGAAVPGESLEGVTDRGVGCGAFRIAKTAPGGKYTLVAKSLDGFFPEERHEFDVRAYRVPQLKKELEFDRRSYGPGDTVSASFTAVHAEGGSADGAKVKVVAKVDDETVFQRRMTTNADGSVAIEFAIPDHVSIGDGQLSVTVDAGSVVETKSKAIPIQVGKIAVDFYPEGGYLVSGLNNRVYFVARNMLGEPIDIRGEIMSRSGEVVATVETVRDGMGKFQFQPDPRQRYYLKVTHPIDVHNSPKLPIAVDDFPVIDTGKGVFGQQDPIDLVVRSKKKRAALVRAVCRGQLVGQRQVTLRGGDNQISIPLRQDASGVIRVTVLDTSDQVARPLVERLVFRRTHNNLNVRVVETGKQLERSPGQPVRLTLQVTGDKNQPLPAVLGVSVVDDASLSLQENESPSLRSHFLLTSEVEKPEDLEHANFYLSDDAQASESLDLLLGTQGWRRFVSGAPVQDQVDFREQLVRLLELDGQSRQTEPMAYTDPIFWQSVTQYRIATKRAWNQALYQIRMMVILLVAIWCLAVAFQSMRLRSPGAVLLLAASTSALIMGCGGHDGAFVVGDAQEETSFAAEAADSGAMAPSQLDATPHPEDMEAGKPEHGHENLLVQNDTDFNRDADDTVQTIRRSSN